MPHTVQKMHLQLIMNQLLKRTCKQADARDSLDGDTAYTDGSQRHDSGRLISSRRAQTMVIQEHRHFAVHRLLHRGVTHIAVSHNGLLGGTVDV